jgi:hypothetical protein
MSTYGFPKQSVMEIKAYDTSGKYLSRSLTAGGTVVGDTTAQLLNGVMQGASFNQHIGRKINMKSILFRAEISLDPSVTAADLANWRCDVCRLMLVYDKQNNGVIPDSATLLDYTGDTLTGGGRVPSASNSWWIGHGRRTTSQFPMNLAWRDRFKIIMDKKVKINSSIHFPITVEKFIKLKGREVVYQGASGPGVAADIATGALWLYVFADNSDSGASQTDTTNILCNWTSRLRFWDV